MQPFNLTATLACICAPLTLGLLELIPLNVFYFDLELTLAVIISVFL